MIASMTGFGHGEAHAGGITVSAELRGVNNRFLEVSTRLPRSLSQRENEIKELIRGRIARGKMNVLITVVRENEDAVGLTVNAPVAKAYLKLLTDLRKVVKSKEPVRLEHLLQFSEVFRQPDASALDEKEWNLTREALLRALEAMHVMRKKEGAELAQDFRKRISLLSGHLDEAEKLSKEQVPRERTRLRERIAQLLEQEQVNEGRLEMELALLADRLDVTEECVRFRSHNKFFLEAIEDPEPAGRKLNFLIQEMNREVNTIGSKSNDTAIAHIVVAMKEELEKIREQLQNIE
jgi:uncharacterized protein (TIGR00255 family)